MSTTKHIDVSAGKALADPAKCISASERAKELGLSQKKLDDCLKKIDFDNIHAGIEKEIDDICEDIKVKIISFQDKYNGAVRLMASIKISPFFGDVIIDQQMTKYFEEKGVESSRCPA